MKKIAIVTGASSGMGREFVIQLEKKAGHVDEIWVIARREERLRQLKEEASCKIVMFPLDLMKKESFEILKERLEEENPKISILVNAAGFGIHGKVEETDEECLMEMIDLNCRSLTCMTRICLPYMAKGGRIIELASSAAFVPQPKFAIYAASKSYVLSFSRALHAELSPRGISVTAVCPGPVDTEFFTHDQCNINRTFYKKMMMAKAEDVVSLALEDAAMRKEVSVYGKGIKAFRLLTKLVPHKMMLAVMKHIL